MGSRKLDQLRMVAYHEAGHAVAAWKARVPMAAKGATIVADKGVGYLGAVHFLDTLRRLPNDVSDTMYRRAEAQVVVTLAGIESQRRFRPRSVRHYHGEQDYHNAIDILSYLTASNRELELHFELLRFRARQMVENPSTWMLIEAVAGALLERQTLSRTEIQQTISDSIAHYQKNRAILQVVT